MNMLIYFKDFFNRKRNHALRYVLFSVWWMIASTAWCQPIERKIIVENGMCFYTTIDPEFQVATLHIVSVDKPVKTAKEYAVPAGRNLNTPIIPFSWDLMGDDLLVINFMNNALNNRRNALKRIPLKELNEWNDKLAISDVVTKSTETIPYTWFEPYSEVLEKSSILDHFFFDAVATTDSSLCVAISNRGELTIWEFSNGKWKKGEDLDMQTDDFFSLFQHKDRPYLVTSDGSLYAVQNNKLIKLADKKIGQALGDGFLIINKTDRSISFLNKEKFDRQKSMMDLLKLHATKIFL